jgi:hypothetical protein
MRAVQKKFFVKILENMGKAGLNKVMPLLKRSNKVALLTLFFPYILGGNYSLHCCILRREKGSVCLAECLPIPSSPHQ